MRRMPSICHCAESRRPDWTHKALAEADIGDAAREQILHGNAAAMLARAARTGHAERAAAE